MITKIKITDFQSHAVAEIQPAAGVNVIVGRNNTGKSALLRALRLLFYNKPDGGDFVRWGAKDAIIEIEYGDHIIKRIKGTHNVYEVDGSVFSNFGKQIPLEVSTILGFHPITVDRNTYEVNFDSPHEAPFFISETDASKGKLFAKLGERILSDLVLLDSCIQSANADVRSLNAEKNVLEAQQTKLETSLEVFERLDELELGIKQLRESLVSIASLSLREESLVNILQEYTAVEKSITYLDQFTTIDIQALISLLDTVVTLYEKVFGLEELFNSFISLEKSTNTFTALVAFSSGPRAELTKLVKEITLVSERLQVLENLKNQLSLIDNAAESIQRKTQGTTKELEKAVINYKELLLEAGKCPFCSKPIAQHDLEMIVKEYYKE